MVSRQLLALGLFCFSSVASAGVITEIGLADFTNPKTLDFEGAPLGAIGSTDSLFTNFGITSVNAVGTDFTDGFGIRNNASRSLWFDDSGLQIVDPGASGLASDEITYTIELSVATNKFGWAWHDQEDDMLVEFFLGATAVGSVVSNGNLVAGASSDNDKYTLFLMNSDAFDRISITNNTGFGGFSIDDLTIESVAVSEPGMLALMFSGLGLLGIGAARRRAVR